MRKADVRDYKEITSIYKGNLVKQKEFWDKLQSEGLGDTASIINYLMKVLELKNEDLAEKADLSVKTISRYRNKKNLVPNKETLLKICIGMGLTVDVALYLLNSANITLKYENNRDFICLKILEDVYKYTVEEINKFVSNKKNQKFL